MTKNYYFQGTALNQKTKNTGIIYGCVIKKFFWKSESILKKTSNRLFKCSAFTGNIEFPFYN